MASHTICGVKGISPVNKTLAKRAVKIREEFQDIPITVIQEHRQFFDDVWNLCLTIIEALEQEPERRSH